MELDRFKWEDHPANPLIAPKWPDWMMADPTVLLPEEAPDGFWHLFANGLFYLQHFVSDDGVAWRFSGRISGGIRPFIFRHEGEYYLFYETSIRPIQSGIAVRRSHDLKEWSEQKIVLAPSLPWHGGIIKTCGNPCVIRRGGGFTLFYSANVVFLKDCLFCEPRFIGSAESKNLTGPYKPHPEPIFSPDEGDRFHNLGAGAIKVVPDAENGALWGFNNGIYTDARGRSRSAILLYKSEDGLDWTAVHDEPILKPEKGWKRALVYALDVKVRGGDAYLFYNARDGWFIGTERIGLAVGRLESTQTKVREQG